jgi:soluble lytic murein transglycosylase-like protein
MSRPSIASFAFLALVCAFIGAPAAKADYAVLRSGERLHISSYEVDGEHVTLVIPGGQVQILAASLLAVEPEEMFRALPAAVVDPGERYANFIHSSAEKHGVDEKLVKLVVEAESNYDAKAVSRKNALGLMQLLPSTAARYAVTNVFDPAQNIEAGTHYLKDLLAKYRGNIKFALAAYNAGPEMVDRYGGVPPFTETQHYVRSITNKLAAGENTSALR